MIVCEHSICDALSLSTVAHELLAALGDEDRNILDNSLNWPPIMEAVIKESLSTSNKPIISDDTTTRIMARIPLASVDFPLIDMAKYCHTEASYGSLNKEETQKLIEMCRREDVTVTSAVSSAILCATYALASVGIDQATHLALSIIADTRRRCVPPVPNHDLSYHTSTIMLFTMPIKDTPMTSEGMWQLAKTFAHHVKTSIDAGQILTLGMIMGMIYQMNMGPPNLAVLPSGGISNWGLLPFREQYGEWKLVGMTPIINVIRSPMPATLVQTVNGILTICYLGPDPVIPPSTLESLCNGTMHTLRQMIED